MTDFLTPPPPPPPPPPPHGGPAGVPYPTDPAERENAVRNTRNAGLAMLIMGILTILMTLLNAVQNDPQELHNALAEIDKAEAEMGTSNPAFDMIRDMIHAQIEHPEITVITLGIGFVLGALMLVGGINMRRVRSYPLCVIGAIAGLIPCLSACCCISNPLAVWALIALLNKNAKAAFRESKLQG